MGNRVPVRLVERKTRWDRHLAGAPTVVRVSGVGPWGKADAILRVGSARQCDGLSSRCALMGVEADYGDPGSRNPQWSGTALWTGCGHCQDKQRKLLIGKGAPGSAQKTGNRVPASGAGWKNRWDRHPAASRLLSSPSVFQNRGGGISTEAALCIEPARQGDGAPRQCTFVEPEADRGRPDPRNPQQIGTVLWTGCGHPQEKQLKWLIQKGVRGSA